jgi:hypothetical protein
MDSLMVPSPVRAAHVIFEGEGFEFEHHHPQGPIGVRALLFLVTTPCGLAWDIVAWCRKTGQVASWLGRAWAIGEETIYDVRLSDHGALPIWRDPLQLLQADREGLVLLRPQAAVHHLDDVGPLLVEDPEHGLELQELLTRPSPRILVPAPEELAA